MRNIELGLQAFVRLWYLKNLNLVFPLKLGGCVFRFSLFLDELGLTENRGAKKKASTSPKTWAMPKSWEKPRLHLFCFKDVQDPSLGRNFSLKLPA